MNYEYMPKNDNIDIAGIFFFMFLKIRKKGDTDSMIGVAISRLLKRIFSLIFFSIVRLF